MTAVDRYALVGGLWFLAFVVLTAVVVRLTKRVTDHAIENANRFEDNRREVVSLREVDDAVKADLESLQSAVASISVGLLLQSLKESRAENEKKVDNAVSNKTNTNSAFSKYECDRFVMAKVEDYKKGRLTPAQIDELCNSLHTPTIFIAARLQVSLWHAAEDAEREFGTTPEARESTRKRREHIYEGLCFFAQAFEDLSDYRDDFELPPHPSEAASAG